MTFEISCTGDSIEKYKKILKKYKCISKKRTVVISKSFNVKREYTDYYIEINSLEELLELQKEIDCELIIGQNYIEIYDDYRE